MFFTEIDRSSRHNAENVLSEGVAFIISTPAAGSTSPSCVTLELNVGCVTGAQVARDIKNIIMNARKKKRQ
jgi:hypothetical protein